MLRYILSWSASSPDFALATLDVTAAFLNAPLPPGRIVVLRPPTILYKLQLLPPGHVWLLCQGERYCVLLSEVHKSLCLIVKEASLFRHPTTDHLGLTARVSPTDVVALSGIYVDDFLTTGPQHVVEAFLNTLRKMWKTSDPQFLSSDGELHLEGNHHHDISGIDVASTLLH